MAYRTHRALSSHEAAIRLESGDRRLEDIKVTCTAQDHDPCAWEHMMDCLNTHPNVVRRIKMTIGGTFPGIGTKLARFVSTSDTVEELVFGYDFVRRDTLMALANALQFNTSLRTMKLFPLRVDIEEFENALVYALRINPMRPSDSAWNFSIHASERVMNSYQSLKVKADELGHPTLQMLLLGRELSDFAPPARRLPSRE